MQIGISTCGSALNEALFRDCARAGVSAVEISPAQGHYDEVDFPALRRFAAAYGVRLWSFHLPFMPFAEIDVSATDADKRKRSVALTAELIRRGHREIAFVGTVGMTSSSMDRCSGFARAMYSAGLQMRPEWFTGDRDEEGNILTALSLPEHLPTAFVCENDVVASVLAGQLMERGLKIPQDISVTGFDDFNYLPSPVALTTYAVDLPRMAEIAVRRLGARVARGPSTPVRIVVSGRVVQRDSVGDAPGCAGIPVKTDL